MVKPNSCTLADFTERPAKYLRQVTKDGEGVLSVEKIVVLSRDAYDELSRKAEFADNIMAIKRGMDDVRAGRVTSAKAVMRRLAKDLGIKFDR